MYTYLVSRTEPSINKQRTVSEARAIYVGMHVIDRQSCPVVSFPWGIQAVIWALCRFIGWFFKVIVVFDIVLGKGQTWKLWRRFFGFHFGFGADITKYLNYNEVDWENNKAGDDAYEYLQKWNREKRKKCEL